MANLIPLASYALEVTPGLPTPASDYDYPVSLRITMAAIDPDGALDDDNIPSTLKIIKRPARYPTGGLLYDSDEDDEEEEEDEDEEDDKPQKKIKQSKGKKTKKDESDEDMAEIDEDDDDDSDDDDDDDDDDFEIIEHVLCTLNSKSIPQQSLDLVITPGEEVAFLVSGSYPVYLTGNYVEHPYDEDLSDEESDELDSDEYDLSPDEDELDLERLGRLRELVSDEELEEEEEAKLAKKEVPVKETKKEQKSKKRASEEEEKKVESAKKQKKSEDKKVAFPKELEQGPASAKKPSVKKLEGGVTVEDRTVGEGPTAKAGQKVGVRYIGKLSNGKVFDSNTKGKPFYFTLGKGEVIKGWDVGVAGMAVKGERRIVIPAPMAYGKQKLPDIPPNSELTFDVKLVNIK
jgi:FK506-binding nuclear protein